MIEEYMSAPLRLRGDMDVRRGFGCATGLLTRNTSAAALSSLNLSLGAFRSPAEW